MTTLSAIFSRQRTVFHPPGIDTKKQCLECIAQCFQDWNPNLKYPHILETLHARERMGHTAIAANVAIPHARISDLEAPVGVLLLLEPNISFDPEGEHPVSLIFATLTPEDENKKHVHTLKQLATLLNEKSNIQTLLDAHDAETLWTQLSSMITKTP